MVTTSVPQTREALRATLVKSLDVLTTEMPVPYKVRLRVAYIKDCYGTCDFRKTNRDGEHFLITICPMSFPPTMDGLQVCLETLTHEYAHAYSWVIASTDGGHGEAWGCAYAGCYRALNGD